MARPSITSFPLRSGTFSRRPRAFSLIEVVLAIGVLSLAVVAMLGLFAPTMGSVKEVVDGNKATALVGMINSKVNNDMDYDDVTPVGTADLYAYAWERDMGDGTIDIVMSEPQTGQPGRTTVVNADGGTSNVNEPSDDRANMAGPAFVVKFERLTLDGYDYADTDTEAYVPFLVTIYQLDMDARFNTANPEQSLNESTRVLSYPSAKLR